MQNKKKENYFKNLKIYKREAKPKQTMGLEK
jgi:hypothetical protein